MCSMLIHKLQLDWFEELPSICCSLDPKPVQGNAISALGDSQILFQGIYDNICLFSGALDDSLPVQQWLINDRQLSWAGIELL